MAEAETVYGIDLAVAAADAGEKTWLTAATPTADGLRVRRTRPATDFLDAGADRGATLTALKRFVRGLDAGAVVGVDCPFGLPGDIAARLVGAVDWRSFLSAFPRLFAGPEDLEGACTGWAREHHDRAYLLRRAEAAVGAQCAYGFIGATLTYHGIAGFLEPVGSEVTVAPMDRTDDPLDGPVVLETYPAGTLAARDLPSEGYTGADDEPRRRRRRCLGGLPVAVPEGIEATVVGDSGGDALDSVVAAEAAARATDRGFTPEGVAREAWALEGYVFT